MAFNFEVEEMTSADINEVMEIWQNTENLCLSCSCDYGKIIGRFLDRNSGLSYIARSQGHIVGVVLGGYDGMYGTLRHAAVLQPYRGKGIMTALVEHSLAGMRACKACEVFWHVLDTNKTAIDFIEKKGWRKACGVTAFSIRL